MRKSKYLGMQSGDWFCSHVGVARVQPAFKKKKDVDGRRVRSKRPGHCTYYYIFERLTSDKKAMKMIRLNAQQVRQVLDNQFTVEDFAKKKAAKRSQIFKEKVSYSFCD
jgi:hypothetical protein